MLLEGLRLMKTLATFRIINITDTLIQQFGSVDSILSLIF